MRLRWKLWAILMGLGSMSVGAQAESLFCNKAQSDCVIRDHRMTLGDKVGIFNHDAELVAVGEIGKLEEEDRHLEIIERRGDIRRGYRFARLTSSSLDMDLLADDYRIFQTPSKTRLHGSVGLAGLGLGAGGSGYEYGAMLEQMWTRDIYYGVRGTVLSAAATVNNPGSDYAEGQLGMFGLSVLPALSVSLRPGQPWLIRAELGAGLMYTSADVDGDSGLVESFVEEFTPGFGLLTRGEISVHYRIQKWAPYVSAAMWKYEDLIVGAWNVGLTHQLR